MSIFVVAFDNRAVGLFQDASTTFVHMKYSELVDKLINDLGDE